MNRITRRRFLVLSGVAGAGALAAGATQIGWDELFAPRATGTAPHPVLVVLTLYGGNDGLSTIVPASDPVYQDSRPELAYQPEDVLDLGDGLGLNPGMPGLKSLWDQKRLAVVQGVGYPEPNRSHFTSMAIWHTASPQWNGKSGWLGRWLDSAGDDPLLALSLEPALPPMLAGERSAAASLPLNTIPLPGGRLGEAFRSLGSPQGSEEPLRALAAQAISDLHELRAATGPVLANGVTPDAEPLAAQLGLVAQLVEAGLSTRVYSVSLGGFDTHADERGTQEGLLARVDAALAPFVRRMRTTERGKHVVVMVYSEFGRRVAANGSQGTDHGTAGPLFVLGERVRGGFYGTQPSLTDLDHGDLKATSDFRDVYATLLEEVLGTDAGTVLGEHRGRLNGVLS